MEAYTFADSCQMMLGIENFKLVITYDITGANILCTRNINVYGLGGVAVKSCCDSLDIEDDFANILFYTGNSGYLVENILAAARYFDADYSYTGKRAEKHAPQRVAEGYAIAALKRFNHKFA